MRKFTIETELVVGKLYYLEDFPADAGDEIVDNSVGEYLGFWLDAHYFGVRFIENRDDWNNFFFSQIHGHAIWFQRYSELTYFEEV